MNILMISVDDLAQWVGPSSVYSSHVHAPNIQKLAQQGTVFSNTYTPEAICNPARTATFSGLDPSRTGVHANEQSWLDYIAPEKMITARFMQAGYEVGGFGKLLHGALAPSIASQLFNEYVPATGYQNGPPDGRTAPLPESVDPADLADEKTVDEALRFLKAQSEGSFMLNVGLVKPHLDWIVPQKFYDLYPLDRIVVPGLVGDDMSKVPAFILDQLDDMMAGHPQPATPLMAKQFVQAYLASVSYADSQIGRLLDGLDASGHTADTAVVLWSDHGYHFGDRDGYWGKFTLWEEAARVPLIVRAPGGQAGRVVEDVVSLLDLAPTLLDLAGIKTQDTFDGDSLVPLLTGQGTAAGDGIAVTWMFGSVMLRTPGWSYIRYEDGSEEFYNMILDPGQTQNLAGMKEAALALEAARMRLAEKVNLLIPSDIPGASPVQGGAEGEVFILNAPEQLAIGGDGDDRYFVNNSNASIIETATGGRDILFTSVSMVLPDHVEELMVQTFRDSAVRYLTGNALNNIISGGRATETIRGLEGDDLIRGMGGFDQIYGGSGNDRIYGWTSNDTIWGDEGNDTLFGLGGADHLYGGDGRDLLVSRGGGASLFGESGDDVLMGGEGGDLFWGGDGTDTVSYATGPGVLADLLYGWANTGVAAGDGYDSIEVLVGSAAADNLRGNDLANLLQGGAGDDWLYGRGGADTLNGGAGNDRLEGGLGKDVLTGGLGNDAFVFASLFEGGDFISDFGNEVGNNDFFCINVSSFQGGLSKNTTLTASQFQSRTDNIAQDANDRFIFCTVDQTLWFDSNGNLNGGLTLLAKLQANAIVEYNDIFLI